MAKANAAAASPFKRAVARAFGRAEDYDAFARVQALAAAQLAAAIAEQPLAPSPRVLEIGCGTGLLTAALRTRITTGSFLVTDIAPAMVARCRARFGADLSYLVMDGERPCLRPGYDLIVSSLAAQWFEDAGAALDRLAGLLAPGGLLAVATLAEGSLLEWEQAQGLPAASRRYPSLDTLASWRLVDCATTISSERFDETHSDGLAFLRALRAIGAQTPMAQVSGGHHRALRPAMRAFEQAGGQVSYVVATILARRSGPASGCVRSNGCEAPGTRYGINKK